MRITGSINPESLRGVRETIAWYGHVCQKDFSASLNRFMRNVVIYASSNTKQADAGKIERELARVVGHQIAGKSGRRLKKPRPIRVPTTLARAIVVKRMRAAGEAITSAAVAKQAQALMAGRKRSVGYHRAGYIPAQQAFGAKLLVRKAKTFGPAKGRATVASELSLKASLTNFAKGIDVQSAAFDRAIMDAMRDMQIFTAGKLHDREKQANAKLK